MLQLILEIMSDDATSKHPTKFKSNRLQQKYLCAEHLANLNQVIELQASMDGIIKPSRKYPGHFASNLRS